MSSPNADAADLRNPARKRALGHLLLEPPTVQAVSFDVATEDVPADMGLLELRQRYQLRSVSRRGRLVAAYLVTEFADPRVRVHRISGKTDSAFDVVVSEFERGCGWLIGDPLGAAPVSGSVEVRATLWVPLDRAELTGTRRLDVTLLRSAWRRRVHGGIRDLPFALPLPDGSARLPLAPPRPVSARRPAVRLCMAADTESYGRFTSSEAARSQERLVQVLAQARRHAGIPEPAVDLQSSGDGQFAILPAGLDETVVIPRLIDGIRTALAAANGDLSDRARLRLRVALHRGHVAAGANGWVGAATVAVHRLLDCAALRERLGRARSADFALIVSDVLFGDVIMSGLTPLTPAAFDEVLACLPEKQFSERAWVHSPPA
ncbi:hypothetical protein [Amycolatopsis sp. cmx-4-68]|uniref:hypothetical protein n=1 Tax=Amycolatopsis sp. cmx-4-68 TaxID=2790938 RepID=UPI0039794628